MMLWASEFSNIPITLASRTDLRTKMLRILENDIPGKAIAGGDRLHQLQLILSSLVNGEIALDAAIALVSQRMPPHTSPHMTNKHVFPAGWEERLIRTQYSRLYNQAVLEQLAETGESHCFVAHSSAERADSQCSRLLAGQIHKISDLLDRILSNYAKGQWSNEPKIPDHPHCTHVISPIPDPSL